VRCSSTSSTPNEPRVRSTRSKRFMSDNNAVIMMVVLLLLGAKLLGDGFAGL
jgi:hypothetical protein